MFEYQETKIQVGKLLKINPAEIQDQDNLIELGINSLKIMRLVNEWRKKGAKVTFAELISHPTMAEWWQLLSPFNETKKTTGQLKAEGSPQKQAAGGGLALPTDDTKKLFGLTDVQYAYWVGRKRGQVLGDVGCHAYLEIDAHNIVVEKLNTAWKELLASHAALRTRFTEDAKQEILTIPTNSDITIYDLRDQTEAKIEMGLADLRDQLSHRKLCVENGENAGLALTLLPNHQARLHFDVDLLAADVQSFQIILRDLAKLYRGETLTVNKKWNFGAYLDLVEKQSISSKQAAEAFWKEKITDLPTGPKLPLKKSPETVEKTVFTAHKANFTSEQWEHIKNQAAKFKITPAMVFLTIYCEILERWSENSRFLVNLPIFNRHTEFEGIEEVVADFSNILLFDVDCSDTKNFVERARQIQARLHHDMQYSAYSGIQVTRELALRFPTEKSIAPVVFACNLGEPLLDQDFRQTLGELEFMVSQTPQVWIDFQMFDYDGGLYIRWDVVEELFPDGMMNQMFDACCEWIEKLAEPDCDWQQVLSVSGIEKTGSDREQIYHIETSNKSNNLLDGLFVSARRSPDKAAVVQSDTGDSLTYDQLTTECLKTAAYLTAAGVEPGAVVAISMERGIQQLIGVLGILACGAVYTPIAVNQPAARRIIMYQKAKAQHVLTNRSSMEQIKTDDLVKVLLIEDCAAALPQPVPFPGPSDASAYIIFTSGSSGEPKGVEISHGGAVNTIEAINQMCAVTASDSVLAVSSLEFDLSVYDIFGALSVGATVVCIPEKERRNADYWTQAVHRYQITIWNSVPILFDMLLISAKSSGLELSSLRWVFLSGDWIGLSLPKRMEEQAVHAKMLAMGGATEASIWSNYYMVDLPLDKSWISIPYGYPLCNQKYCIMDEKLRPCPDWTPGELWIGGKGLALSYVGEPQLTAEKFIIHEGQRWYRTGDLGRYWNDGKIEFLGRKDFQVKVRGHRIELGEIESAIVQNTKVDDAVVVAKEQPSGQKELIAFLVTKESEINLDNLTEFLKHKLPEYMLPEHYFLLSKLPLSSNGKVDRKKLLAEVTDELRHQEGRKKQKPATEIERKLADIWKAVLKQEEIFMEDSYFRLGGDSLIATQLSAEIQCEFEVKFMLEDVFLEPVFRGQVKLLQSMLEDQAEGINVQPDGLPTLTFDETARFEPFPLTEIQKAYWIGRKGIYDSQEVSTHYYFEIENTDFDIAKFKQAFQAFLLNHDMMRAIILEDGERQVVLKDIPPYTLPEYHFEELGPDQIDDQIDEIRQQLAHRIFKPEEWPLFDIRISVLPDKKVRLHLCFDNIIFDGWSIFFFFHEINQMYNQDQYPIRQPEIIFRDYVLAVEELKNTAAFELDKEYWMKRLEALPPAPELPTQESEIQTFEHLEYRLPESKWARIKKHLSQLGGITPSVFLITAYAEILATWSKHQKFTINLTRFNRMPMHPDINQVVGDFTSLTLLEIDLQTKKSSSFIESCRSIQRQLLKDLEHSLFCGVQVQRELGKRYQNHQGVLMPVVFTSSLGLKLDQTAGRNWFENRIYSSSETPQVWLDHQVTEEKGNLVLIWDYVKELFPAGMVAEMFDAYIKLIETLDLDLEHFNHSDIKLIDVPRIHQFETENWQTTPVSDETLVSLVERQAQITPENIAVIYQDTKITYQELMDYVDLTAIEIQSQTGAKSPLIGIFMEKGIDQIVAALAIMKSGAAYLPLDPHHPSERIRNLLAQAGVKMVLSQSWIEKESISEKQWIDVDTIDKKDNEEPLFKVVNPETAAYVIYTSGSTGEPKGVTITHRSVVNTILDINERFQVGGTDRCIALSNLNFDLSVYDIFGLLAAGGTVVIPAEKQLKDPAAWVTLLKEHQVSIWNTVPAFMSMLVEFIGPKTMDASLRLIMLSGDWIPLFLPERAGQLFPDSLFVSLGGATEAAIWSNYYIVEQVLPEWNSIPYGKPLCNQALYVYNDRLQPCPCGVCGDLYIGGTGVAVGYWNDQIRTAKQFIQHPVTGERIYKTGDLARYMEDGNIEFLGREDNQVKIRGFRIGLGEIENSIQKCPAVKEATVVVDNSQQLLAFLLAETEENSYDHDELKMAGVAEIKAIQTIMEQADNRSHITNMLTAMDTISRCAAADILRRLGISTDGPEGDLIELDQRYQPLIQHWMEQLKQPEVEDLSFNQPLKELMEYYQLTQDLYIEVLQGHKDVISLFLADEFKDATRKLTYYQQINQYYYDVAEVLLKNYTDQYTKAERISILEIGTRFGTMLETISKSDQWTRWDYTYSDESTYFLQEKERQYPDIQVKIFDINKPVERQSIAGEKYHLILADNTLHRAKDIHIAMENIKQLLLPEGVLIFIENTKLNCFDLNIAGLYEYGFSQYTDERQDRQQPFEDQAGWRRYLNHSAMDIVDIFADTDEITSVYGRHLYVAKATENRKNVDRSALNQFLSAQLPEYMVPNHYTVLYKFPITANGKTDRKRLLEKAQFDSAKIKELIEPENDVEVFIHELWKRMLCLEAISVEDKFFEIGGDSLLAIQCMNQLIKEYGVEVSLQDIFKENSIRNLANMILARKILCEEEGEI